MSRTTATAVHAAAVVLVFWVAFSGGRAFGAAGAPGTHDHPAPSPAATPMADMPGMSADEHAAMVHSGQVPASSASAAAGVSDSTRAVVLGAFGAANAAAVGAAYVLRRRGAAGSRPRFAR